MGNIQTNERQPTRKESDQETGRRSWSHSKPNLQVVLGQQEEAYWRRLASSLTGLAFFVFWGRLGGQGSQELKAMLWRGWSRRLREETDALADQDCSETQSRVFREAGWIWLDRTIPWHSDWIDGVATDHAALPSGHSPSRENGRPVKNSESRLQLVNDD